MEEEPSNLELRIMKKLYKDFIESGKIVDWRCLDAFTYLKLKNGSDLSTVNSSKYISSRIHGTYEYWYLNEKGIRYMDAISRKAKESSHRLKMTRMEQFKSTLKIDID
jgi:hypothetical protein